MTFNFIPHLLNSIAITGMQQNYVAKHVYQDQALHTQILNSAELMQKGHLLFPPTALIFLFSTFCKDMVLLIYSWGKTCWANWKVADLVNPVFSRLILTCILNFSIVTKYFKESKDNLSMFRKDMQNLQLLG